MIQDLKEGIKVLITTSAWFYAPNGRQYNAVWGTIKAIHKSDDLADFQTTRGHFANWIYEVGGMFISGCQVNYIIKCPEKPNTEKVKEWTTKDTGFMEYERPSVIYIADEE